MKASTRLMSFEMFKLALSYYPGPKLALSTLTEEQFARLPWVLGTKTSGGKREYLLNLLWTP